MTDNPVQWLVVSLNENGGGRILSPCSLDLLILYPLPFTFPSARNR